jgi:hypothetical protein
MSKFLRTYVDNPHCDNATENCRSSDDLPVRLRLLHLATTVTRILISQSAPWDRIMLINGRLARGREDAKLRQSRRVYSDPTTTPQLLRDQILTINQECVFNSASDEITSNATTGSHPSACNLGVLHRDIRDLAKWLSPVQIP